MTEHEWLTSDDPDAMIHQLGENFSPRKFRLFAVACCRRVWRYFTSPVSLQAILCAEAYAEGQATLDQLTLAQRSALAMAYDFHDINQRSTRIAFAAGSVCHEDALQSALQSHYSLGPEDENLARWHYPDGGGGEPVPLPAFNRRPQAYLLRDIAGNPFHSTSMDPSWLTPNVLSLAQTIYADRQFEDLPILADALLEAGCHEEKLLQHCQDELTHERGCWVIDLVLGRG